MTLPQKDLVFLESVHRWCRSQISHFGRRRKYQPARGFSKEEIDHLQKIITLDHAVRGMTETVAKVE